MTSTAIITKTYNDTTVLTFRQDGWFNMTKAAKAFGKDLQSFMRADTTVELLEDMQTNSVSKTEYVETTRGRTGGTWAHPELAIEFARWLDVKFARWCNAVIKDIMTGAAQVNIVKPEQSEILKMPTSLLETAELWIAELRKNEALKLENNELKEEKALLEHEVTHLTITEFRTNIRWFFPASVRTKLSMTAKKLTEAAGESVGVKYHTRTDPVRGDHQVKVYVYPVKYLHQALLKCCPDKAHLLDNI